MNFNEVNFQSEECIMEAIRTIIPKIVEVRIMSMQMRKWLANQGAENAIAEEEITEAIDALYKAETSFGNTHQSVLIANATNMIINNTENKDISLIGQ